MAAVQTRESPTTAEPTQYLFKVDDYYRMAEVGILPRSARVELIEGEIIQMSPIGVRHQECIDNLTDLLVPVVRRSARVRVQGPTRLSDLSEPQPDVMVLRGRANRTAHPGPQDVLLLIEVSDTSLSFDRTVKLPLYSRMGVREVWIIDLNSNSISRHTEPSEGGYQKLETYKRGDRIESGIAPDLNVSLTVDEILS